jgi:hypothetical protein
MEDMMTLQEAVEEYCHLHNLAPFEVSELYDLERVEGFYPNCGKPGCYVFFSAVHALLYVGKASLGSNLGARIGAHIGYNDIRTSLVAKRPDQWPHGLPKYVQTVATRHSYEAPSLEEFLMAKLEPPTNILKPKSNRAIVIRTDKPDPFHPESGRSKRLQAVTANSGRTVAEICALPSMLPGTLDRQRKMGLVAIVSKKDPA